MRSVGATRSSCVYNSAEPNNADCEVFRRSAIFTRFVTVRLCSLLPEKLMHPQVPIREYEQAVYVYWFGPTLPTVKIGHSNNPDQRLAQLGNVTGVPDHLASFAAIVWLDRKREQVEARAHALAAQFRRSGEWFELTASAALGYVISAAEELHIRYEVEDRAGLLTARTTSSSPISGPWMRCSKCGQLTNVPPGSTRPCSYCGSSAPLLSNRDTPVQTNVYVATPPGQPWMRCRKCCELTNVPVGSTRPCSYCGSSAPLLSNMI